MEKIILDACCGGKMFWFDKSNPLTIFADIRSGQETFTDMGNTRTLEIYPDVIHDFTNMPYPDKSFKLVIFDPPHLTHGGDKSWLVKKYGRLDKNWQEQLSKGFSECFRVLEENGILIFKWNETQVPVSDILALAEYSPIIGHKSGKRSNTHWMVFMKNELMKMDRILEETKDE